MHLFRSCCFLLVSFVYLFDLAFSFKQFSFIQCKRFVVHFLGIVIMIHERRHEIIEEAQWMCCVKLTVMRILRKSNKMMFVIFTHHFSFCFVCTRNKNICQNGIWMIFLLLRIEKCSSCTFEGNTINEKHLFSFPLQVSQRKQMERKYWKTKRIRYNHHPLKLSSAKMMWKHLITDQKCKRQKQRLANISMVQVHKEHWQYTMRDLNKIVALLCKECTPRLKWLVICVHFVFFVFLVCGWLI